jgi:RNA polymerase sigma-70 factor, ECF subfamily
MTLSQEDVVRTLLAARARISGAVWAVTRDVQAAEDIFQNVSVKALGTPFEGEAQLLSWAKIVARHEALNWARDRKGKAGTLDEEVLERLDEAEEGERSQAVRTCLEKLPSESRRLLELRYVEGRSCGEISRETGQGLDALYQRISRLHRALKRCAEERLA